MGVSVNNIRPLVRVIRALVNPYIVDGTGSQSESPLIGCFEPDQTIVFEADYWRAGTSVALPMDKLNIRMEFSFWDQLMEFSHDGP